MYFSLLIASISILLQNGFSIPLNNNPSDLPLYNPELFQGDIVGFDPNTEDRASVVDVDFLWPEGIVHYVIGESAQSLKEYILAGIEEYHQKTCIRFKEKTPEVKDYVQIEWWQGCNSMLGRMGGQQFLSLGSGCHYKGLVVHELAHALGFIHEQARSDRDDYIEVQWNNIMEDFKPQFIKMKPYEHNLLNEKFDYKSVMLYEETAFSKDGSPTVKVLQPDTVIGPVWQKEGLSESDVRRVNRLYQCFGEVRPSPPDVPDFVCAFEENDCGIVNQDNMGSDFERAHVTIGDRTGFMMISDLSKAGSIGARLITPHFLLYGRQIGCLSFDYYFSGDGVYEFSVHKQSTETNLGLEDRIPSNEWKTAKFPIHKAERDARFFLTATFSRVEGMTGFFAIDNLLFTLNPCS